MMNDSPQAALPAMFLNPAQIPALFADLALAQAEYTTIVRDKLVVQKLKNKSTGEYTGGTIKFMYADLASILAATVPALAKHGLSFFQPLEHGEGDVVWLNSILAHKDGGMLVSRMQIPGAADLKLFGGNITYLRRYAAGPMLGVSSEDDADEDGNGAGDGEGGDWPPRTSERSTPKAPLKPKVPESYPEDAFRSNLPAWAKLISSGTKTPEQIIFTVESKGRPMTQDQKIELASFITNNTGAPTK
jgi:hypothetical protein